MEATIAGFRSAAAVTSNAVRPTEAILTASGATFSRVDCSPSIVSSALGMIMKPKTALLMGIILGSHILAARSSAQQFAVSATHPAVWNCHGWIWIGKQSLYCSDPRNHQLTKVGLDGGSSTDFIPATGKHPKAVLAMAQATNGNVYIVDGAQIDIFQPDGSFKSAINVGVSLSTGIALLDDQHMFVTGWPHPQSDPKATVFLVGPGGVENKFSDVFVKGLSDADDFVVNSASYLALDRMKGVLYQVGQNLYEIRVFDLKGTLLKTIAPPSHYALRAPNIKHVGKGSMLEPGDAISDIVVLGNGGLAVTGDTMDFAETQGAKTTMGYSKFVDLYDGEGRFLRRLRGNDLQFNDSYFVGFDHITGHGYFRNSATVTEGEIR